MKPRLLDLFCGAGGASVGYWRCGFEVVGVDIDPQPSYPFKFIRADALDYMRETWAEGFDVVHASPPCQAFTQARKLRSNDHPNLIAPIRELLLASDKPFVIENVVGAPLRTPILLEGSMFGLSTYRPRLFEVTFDCVAPPRPPRNVRTTKMGRPPREDEFMHVVGNFSGANEGRLAMGINWMSKNELREAIPPAYSAYVGCFIHAHLGTDV